VSSGCSSRDGWVANTILFVTLAALTFSSAPAGAGVLRGHLSGLKPELERVDLRIRFFSTVEADRLLTELRFDQVELDAGTFEVSLDERLLPPDARFVAIALRPSARRYAAYQPIAPRRHLERRPATMLIATVRTQTPTNDVTGLPVHYTEPNSPASGEQ